MLDIGLRSGKSAFRESAVFFGASNGSMPSGAAALVRLSCAHTLLLALVFCVPFAALAAEPISYGEGVIPAQKDASVVKALGADLFGESINASTGGLSFSQVDATIPGNAALAVEVRRRLSIDGNKSPSWSNDVSLWKGHLFGEWELDVPFLTGIYTETSGWVVDTSTPTQRCSSPASRAQFRPKNAYVGQVTFTSYNFWNGIQLNIPGGGEEQLLYMPSNSPLPKPAGAWTQLTTKSQWRFGCLSSLASGQPGEGFLALSPDGVRYWLNWMVEYEDRPMRGSAEIQLVQRSYTIRETLNRRALRLYPTRVEDRFGNYVTYSWSGNRLNQISGSDGRLINLTYNGSGQVATVVSGTQTTTYGYLDGLLGTVTRPDGSQWSYVTGAVVDLARFMEVGSQDGTGASFDHPYDCQLMRRLAGGQADLTMSHPSGANAVFRMGYNRLYRTNLAGSTGMCAAVMKEDGQPISWFDHQPNVPTRFDVLALQRKTISGPGLSGQVWQFTYQDHFTVANGHPSQGTREVSTVHPDGRKVIEIYGTDALVNEGQLLSREILSGSTVLSRTENTYVQSAEIPSMPFPDWMGEPLGYEFIRGRGDYNRPLKESVLIQQGRGFTNRTDLFDGMARAIQVTRMSAPAP